MPGKIVNRHGCEERDPERWVEPCETASGEFAKLIRQVDVPGVDMEDYETADDEKEIDA